MTDELTVPLRSGPSVQHRIIYANLPAGTELEIMSINKEAEFTQVKTRRGTEGWIRSEYLKVGPIARDLLSSLETIAILPEILSSVYSILNIDIGYAMNGFRISLWGKNITDERFAIRGFYFGLEPPAYEDKLYLSYGDPKELGIKLSYQF